ncbi:GNAT family N-acetyltransferase [Isoptericola halotolerans]|uniref:GNAT superfamily N-acetyltransferase n=1 Tax=Isoptericola halotolerans TaxID=300560 RepID=A0ABX2A2B6_9MICO|nr:GNAT family N-acetyltransferase [Isoptericola halotolerans]NOV97002.1 GNAT superfamily N-acetyltransferase [Isoptericola halotolerans]
MSTGTTAWRILGVPCPDTLEAPEAWAHHGIAALEAAAQRADLGDADTAPTAAAVLADLHHQEHERTVRLVAVSPDDDGRHVIGAATLRGDLRDNPDWADLDVVVHPDHRRQGLGTALADRIEAEAAADGRPVLVTEVMYPEPAPHQATLVPPTGTGRAPADHPGITFARGRGYRLEQVERRSVLTVPLDPVVLEGHVTAARARSRDYRLHTWHDEIPDRWAEGFAVLETRMSTDVPSGEMDWAEEVWDADRVGDLVARFHQGRQEILVTAAEHVGTGELVAMTMLAHRAGPGPSADQEDTIVLRHHRGHRLGLLVKAVNLQALARSRPQTRRVHTWNAEENDHMLAINVALGFRPEGGAATLRVTRAAR